MNTMILFLHSYITHLNVFLLLEGLLFYYFVLSFFISGDGCVSGWDIRAGKVDGISENEDDEILSMTFIEVFHIFLFLFFLFLFSFFFFLFVRK